MEVYYHFKQTLPKNLVEKLEKFQANIGMIPITTFEKSGH